MRKEVTDEGREAGQAGRPGELRSQGSLTDRGGRSALAPRRPPPVSRAIRYRLNRSVELFPASDGSFYLLRSEADDEFVLRSPTDLDRALLDLLAEGFIEKAELEQALQRRGLPTEGLDGSLAELERLGLVERAQGSGAISPEDRERYDRQLIYFSDLAPGDSGEALQRRLGQATVVILGCGGLGSWTACGLACAGVGTLRLVDDDDVELSNLNRQLLFTEADLGRPKVEIAARALRRHNSAVNVSAIRRRVSAPDRLADLLDDADLLIATADWPPYDLPRWINQACLDAGVPWIGAGQLPPLVRIGPLVLPHESACLECLERQTRRDFPLYDELAAHRTRHPTTAATVGAASGIVGSMLAMEALHLLIGVETPASVGTAVILDLRTLRVTHERVDRDPDCPLCASVGSDGDR